MKWYIASRTKHSQTVANIIKKLEAEEHTVTFDWTGLPDLRPFEQHAEACRILSNQISSSILASDVFVLISDPEGTDMFIELGIAIAQHMKYQSPKIFVIGPHNKRSLMHFHPSIKHVENFDEIVEIVRNNEKK